MFQSFFSLFEYEVILLFIDLFAQLHEIEYILNKKRKIRKVGDMKNLFFIS